MLLSTVEVVLERDVLKGYLARAEAHVLEGELHLAKQRRVVERLKANGHDITSAEGLLAMLEQSQALHVAGRNRLEGELADRVEPVLRRRGKAHPPRHGNHTG